MSTTDTFTVTTAKVFDIAGGLVAAHHATASNDRLLWGDPTPWETYVKVALNAPQSKYVALTGENYYDMIRKVWDNAGRTRTGQGSFTLQLFVYLEKHEEVGIRRATQQNIALSATRVADHVRQHDLQLGPLQTEYVNISTARLPATSPVEVPTNTTMQQLGHMDLMAQRHAEERAHHVQMDEQPYRCVRMRLGALTSPPIDCFISVEDLREILGLPSYPLVPPFRVPLQPTNAPRVNIEDVDHIDS
ncbi:hypothetical protein H257_02315 [Aphanomyces astaci]|uniref:Uncharacterized protein n=1 Tax=Aphanomyces astaci TaxID=112090 RepID=W4H2A4_APHAT|nr:hypothetical protein H257_02315 [Aphanomyces astaci]ETV85716.1 hypothetical protein H257_02315 [Aphanomyces astaci]|eukprot:XP_009824188.1 hypothetical protein H257_02315 [Aphanomyces astaci]